MGSLQNTVISSRSLAARDSPGGVQEVQRVGGTVGRVVGDRADVLERDEEERVSGRVGREEERIDGIVRRVITEFVQALDPAAERS